MSLVRILRLFGSGFAGLSGRGHRARNEGANQGREHQRLQDRRYAENAVRGGHDRIFPKSPVCRQVGSARPGLFSVKVPRVGLSGRQAFYLANRAEPSLRIVSPTTFPRLPDKPDMLAPEAAGWPPPPQQWHP